MVAFATPLPPTRATGDNVPPALDTNALAAAIAELRSLGLVTSAEVTAALTAALAGKADTATVTALSTALTALQNAVTALPSAADSISPSELSDALYTVVRQPALATALDDLKDELLGGAGGAYDTLAELKGLLDAAQAGDATSLVALLTAVNARVPLADLSDPASAARVALDGAYAPVGAGPMVSADHTGVLRLRRVGDGAPIFSFAAQNMVAGQSAAPSVYWPCLVHAKSTIGPSALDEWYLLYSTDHDTGGGGIYLATAPTWHAPFTGRGKVFTDTVSGNQTETPTAVWLPDEQLFAVLYQNQNVAAAVGKQTTCVATSPTLLAGSFTRVGIAIDIPAGGAVPGDGHTGYASVHQDGGVYYAHHLMGGSNPSQAGISQSVDMRTWWMDTRPLAWAVDQVGDGVHRIAWGGTNVVRYKGALWMIGTLTNGAAGTDPRDGRIITARLAEDRRHIIGKPLVQLFPVATGAGEDVNYRSVFATVTPDGQLAVVYQCNQTFFAATAVDGSAA